MRFLKKMMKMMMMNLVASNKSEIGIQLLELLFEPDRESFTRNEMMQ